MIYRFALFVAACTFVLILAGGLVTSTGSGLSVPDWPLSYGSLNPPMVGGIRFEHSHRLIAGFVGLIVLCLMILVWRKDRRAWMKHLATAAFAGVLLQALLGGLTVLFLLPLPVSVAHACLGQMLFAVLSILALGASTAWRDAVPEVSVETPTLRRMAGALAVAVYAQLILGAFVRHAGGGVAILLHIGGAGVVLALSVTSFCSTLRSFKGVLRKFAKAVLHATLLQIALGIGAYYFTIHIAPAPQPRGAEVFFATAHQAVGALVLAVACLFAVASHRFAGTDRSG